MKFSLGALFVLSSVCLCAFDYTRNTGFCHRWLFGKRVRFLLYTTSEPLEAYFLGKKL